MPLCPNIHVTVKNLIDIYLNNNTMTLLWTVHQQYDHIAYCQRSFYLRYIPVAMCILPFICWHGVSGQNKVNLDIWKTRGFKCVCLVDTFREHVSVSSWL